MNGIDVTDELDALRAAVSPEDDIVMWSKPFDPDRLSPSFTQSAQDPKPKGLWYATGLEWVEWSVGERFGIGDGNFVYKLEINKSDFLLIRTVAELDAFARQYSTPLADISGFCVDWPRVTARYSGIEISPYQYDRRFSEVYLWYYGWDVASGATWRPSDTIVSVEELRP